MYCKECGREIPEGTMLCSDCVTKAQGGGNVPGQVRKAPYNTMCIVGFVMGIISLFLNFWGIIGIVATVLSVVGVSQCSQRNENGKALGIVGIVLGAIGVLWGLYSIFVLASLL